MAEYSGKDKRLQYLFEAVENVQVDDMTGASASTDGAHGLVPAPLAGDKDKYLKGDGTWAAVQAGAGALSGLSDVNLTAPTNGQTLVYDGANSKWINGNVSGGGNTLVIQDASIYSTEEQQVGVWTDGIPIYQKTYQAQFSAGASTVQISLGVANIKHIISIEGILVPNGEPNRSIAIGGYSNSYNDDWLSFSANDTYQQNGYVTVRRRGDGYWGSDPYVYVTVRYTKTTDAAGSGGYKAYGLSPIIYSTEEREVGVWTDGKPLYQKTYEIDARTLTVTSGWATIDSTINAERMVWQEISAKDKVYGESKAVALKNDGSTVPRFQIADTAGAFQYYTNTTSFPFNDCIWMVTIRYTKTTDTAGSGTWTTKGTYAHHYSTAEQVIGTWTDGKPLYEITLTKTFSTSDREGATSFYHGSIDISSDIPNLKHGFVVTDASYYGTYPNERGFIFGYVEPDGSASGATVLVGTLFQRSNFTAQLTIRYTKTTD